ncbi:MAG TPA: DUF1697 domain-containing protein [Candidatus Saccharimonadales bacterium]|nr:DUF1697 domain-containing protein [Candidatus Saccharimonadales bacterium]
MVYVALLRGINVGGKSRVEMARLKIVFENLGCGNISTYINSGNVIFTDDRPIKKLTPLIEQAVAEEFKLAVPVVLRDRPDIEKLCQKIPADWTNDLAQRTDVLFLWDEIDSEDVMQKIRLNPDIETARYLPGALVWNIGRENVTRGGMARLIGTDVYKLMTIRNINTVRKLNELMASA